MVERTTSSAEPKRARKARWSRRLVRWVICAFFAFTGSLPGLAAGETVRLGIPVFAIQYAPLYFGKKIGAFAAEGLDVEIQILRTDLALAALGSGKLDFIGHGGAALRVAGRGFPLKLLLALDDRAAFWLMTQPAIDAPALLKGKQVGISFPGDTPHLVLRRYLRKHGLRPDHDVVYVSGQISPIGFQGLSAGALDAAVMAPPYSVVAEQNGFRPLAHLGNEVPDAPTINGIVASERKIREAPGQVERMVRATLKAAQQYRKDPKAATAFLASAFDLPRGTAARVYRDATAVMTANGEVSVEKLRDALNLGRELGLTNAGVGEPETLLNFSFVRAARGRR